MLHITNNDHKTHSLVIADKAYKTSNITKTLAAGASTSVILDLSKSHNWYDFGIKTTGNNIFEERFIGRVETGATTQTDSLMGGLV